MDPSAVEPYYTSLRPVQHLTLGIARLYDFIALQNHSGNKIIRSANVVDGRRLIRRPSQVIPHSNANGDIWYTELSGVRLNHIKSEDIVSTLDSSPFKSHSVHAGEILVDRYRPIAEIGAGSFATTFLAEDILSGDSLPRHVAIKKLGREFTRIGQHEITLLASLRRWRTTQFVQYISSFISNGSLHLVMEYMDSKRPISLPRCVHLNKHPITVCPVRLSALSKISMQLLSGLHELHSHGWIHCDLKPDNIMYSSDREDASHASFKIKIIDLGNATRYNETYAYHDNYDIQSVGYRAPEVLVGDPGFDSRIDIWSAGVILLELLLGDSELLNGKGRIVQGGTRIEVVKLIREWFGSVQCYKDTASLWMDEFGDSDLEDTNSESTNILDYDVREETSDLEDFSTESSTPSKSKSSPMPLSNHSSLKTLFQARPEKKRKSLDPILGDYVRRRKRRSKKKPISTQEIRTRRVQANMNHRLKAESDEVDEEMKHNDDYDDDGHSNLDDDVNCSQNKGSIHQRGQVLQHTQNISNISVIMSPTPPLKLLSSPLTGDYNIKRENLTPIGKDLRGLDSITPVRSKGMPVPLSRIEISELESDPGIVRKGHLYSHSDGFNRKKPKDRLIFSHDDGELEVAKIADDVRDSNRNTLSKQCKVLLLDEIMNDPRRDDLSTFLRSLLSVNYHERSSAEQALRHRFLVHELLGTWGGVLLSAR
ncbi:kinase-like domain-containing protein [Dipodascopsis uninucleata]